jgi:hypothetical protein
LLGEELLQIEPWLDPHTYPFDEMELLKTQQQMP